MICDDMPLLLWFQCDNPFSESEGNFRYCLSPKDNDEKERSLLLEIWTGKFCKEKSEILYSKEFPMSDDGIQEAVTVIKEKLNTIALNFNPPLIFISKADFYIKLKIN